jgi:hypothetical protein
MNLGNAKDMQIVYEFHHQAFIISEVFVCRLYVSASDAQLSYHGDGEWCLSYGDA